MKKIGIDLKKIIESNDRGDDLLFLDKTSFPKNGDGIKELKNLLRDYYHFLLKTPNNGINIDDINEKFIKEKRGHSYLTTYTLSNLLHSKDAPVSKLK